MAAGWPIVGELRWVWSYRARASPIWARFFWQVVSRACSRLRGIAIRTSRAEDRDQHHRHEQIRGRVAAVQSVLRAAWLSSSPR